MCKLASITGHSAVVLVVQLLSRRLRMDAVTEGGFPHVAPAIATLFQDKTRRKQVFSLTIALWRTRRLLEQRKNSLSSVYLLVGSERFSSLYWSFRATLTCKLCKVRCGLGSPFSASANACLCSTGSRADFAGVYPCRAFDLRLSRRRPAAWARRHSTSRFLSSRNRCRAARQSSNGSVESRHSV